MACKRCRKKINPEGGEQSTMLATTVDLVRQTIFYFYCPVCEKVTVKRLSDQEVMGIRCETCKGKVLRFNRAPSMQKLRAIKEQRFKSFVINR